ncbi:hypothetical protein [Comamonas jiangduensis]|uniref:DUF5636 domain-containing protein n=1 Tax=Comamonas jiangduensis TaxID=1194168 RepID=A0ABV4IGQ2_9BURK
MTDLTMSQFASKDDLIAAQAVRIAELEAEVDAERHHHGIRNASAVRTLHALGYSWRGTDAWQPPAEQGKCLHQIAEPQPEALRLAAWLLHRGMSGIKQNDIEASNQLRWLHAESLQHQQELAAYRFTVENREARIAELEAELEAVGAGGVQRLAAAPQAAVPLFWVRLLRDGLYEGPVHNNSVGGKMLRDEKPGEWHPLYLHAAHAHPAEGVHAAVIAGAIFDFAGYLTTLPHEKALHCSEAHEASPMVEAITEWCKRRGLRTDGARVETWRAALAAQPAAQGLDAKDAARYRFIKNHSLILSGGTREFGWPISPFGVECDRYIDKELAAQAKHGGAA